MKKGKTDITMLLDRSGSMKSVQKATIDMFNEFVSQQKSVAGEADLSLIQFDSEDSQEVVFQGSLKQTPELTESIFVPRGMTPLRDAMGLAMTKAGQRFHKLSEEDKPEHVIFVILTDGFENASHEYTQSQIADMVSEQTSKYKWNFVFLGANQNAVLTAKGFNITEANAATYVSSNYGTRAAGQAMGMNVSHLRSTGDAASLNFTKSQRKTLLEDDPNANKEKTS